MRTEAGQRLVRQAPDPIRVVLVDDHPALRVGLRVLLDREPDIVVVGEAEDGASAIEMSLGLHPDVVVLDCQMPQVAGGAVAARLSESEMPPRVVALSAYDDDRYIANMVEAGAVGYLLKNEAPGRIAEAVRRAATGNSLWTDEQKGRATRWQEEIAQTRDSLTERELQVLTLLAQGLSNKEIAQALVVTVRTVDFHVSNILHKLDVVSRVEAAVWAREHLTG